MHADIFLYASELAWNAEYNYDGSGGNYSAEIFNILMPAGLNEITFNYYGSPFNRVGASFAPVQEPATMLLLGTGLVGVAGAARRRKKNQA